MLLRSRTRASELPAGKHDDQVDALAPIGQLLGQMVARAKTPEKPKVDSGYRPIGLDDGLIRAKIAA
jgi:hypothetical protein